jgi:hypothetical protein
VEEIFQNYTRCAKKKPESDSAEEQEEESPEITPKRPNSDGHGSKGVSPDEVEALAEWVAQYYSDWKGMTEKMRWVPFAEIVRATHILLLL